MKYRLLLVFFCVQICISCEPQIEELYVSSNGANYNSGLIDSPLLSIDVAIEKSKKIKKRDKDTQIVIHVLKGEYRLTAPIKISSELSGIKIIGEGLDKVVVKGSKMMHLNWRNYKDKIWVAKVDEGTQFDQLYINGVYQILARYPNYNEKGVPWQGYAPDAISPERVKSWKKPIGAIVHVMHAGRWGGFHYVISDVKEDGNVVLSGGHQNNRPSSGLHKEYRMVENVFEELDSPGEWYLDRERSLVYLWPTEGVNIENSQVEGVILKQLIEIIGENKKPIYNITVSGIKFEHSQRTFMEEYEPLLRSDWTIYRGGAIFIENAENITVEDCEFTNLGGNVIFVSKYNRNVKIIKNHIHECGATAVSFVGNPSAVRSPSFQYREFVPLSKMDTVNGPLNKEYPAKCIVDNNLIHRIGRIEKQTAGVHISMAMNITVSNNSIYDVPRSGINVSEGTWGGHIIEYNDVFNTVLETSDHGAFNSWGRDRFWHPNRKEMDKITAGNPEMPKWDAIHTTIIRNNRFRCDHGWDIDLDDGSSNYELYNNVCLNGGIKLREGFYRTVENNIMVNNSFHPHVWFKNSSDVFRKNIVMTAYRDIRLQAWGKEIDYNLFSDKTALYEAQKKGVDKHGVYGNPMFINPKIGDYTVAKNSPAFKIGYVNFPMDNFGVKKQSLKMIAKTPTFTKIWTISDSKSQKIKTINWLGATVKNIETIAERSSSGLNKTAGVLITEIKENSVIGVSELVVGDVIIASEGKEIDAIPDLMKIFQRHNWKGKLNLVVFRNQKPLKLILATRH